MRLCIGVPTYGTIKTKTFVSIVKFVKSVSYDVPVITQIGSYIQDNRETIVETAIEHKMTHLLFIDHDMIFEPEAVHSLVQRNKDIIGAPFALRTESSRFATVKGTDPHGNKIWEEYPDGLIKCCAVGTGFMLINLEVFKKIPKPWFQLEYDDKGELQYGEDMSFCRKAREAGFDIFCDSKVNLLHIGDYYYGEVKV